MKLITTSVLTLLALYVLYSEPIKLPPIVKKNKKLCYILIIGSYLYYHQNNGVEGHAPILVKGNRTEDHLAKVAISIIPIGIVLIILLIFCIVCWRTENSVLEGLKEVFKWEYGPLIVYLMIIYTVIIGGHMAVGRIVDHMPWYTWAGFVFGGYSAMKVGGGLSLSPGEREGGISFIIFLILMVSTAADYPDLSKKGFSGQSVTDKKWAATMTSLNNIFQFGYKKNN